MDCQIDHIGDSGDLRGICVIFAGSIPRLPNTIPAPAGDFSIWTVDSASETSTNGDLNHVSKPANFARYLLRFVRRITQPIADIAPAAHPPIFTCTRIRITDRDLIDSVNMKQTLRSGTLLLAP